MARSELKVLYLQVRSDPITCEEELKEFARYSGLQKTQFSILNVFATPGFDPSCVSEYDGLFVGGSSDASSIEPEKYPFVKNTEKMLLYCLDNNIPVFASCYGFQAAVVALGGMVALDKEKMEMGTYEIHLTEDGKKDILLHDTPSSFWAVSGHKERAVTLPKKATLLAFSELCPYHAIKIEGKPFYAFQFHPEVNVSDLVIRITRYKERYLDDDDALEKIVRESKETTTESNMLIRRFVDRVLLENY